MSERTAAELRTIAGKAKRAADYSVADLEAARVSLEKEMAAFKKHNEPRARAEAMLADPKIMQRRGLIYIALEIWFEPNPLVLMVLSGGIVRDVEVDLGRHKVRVTLVHPLFPPLHHWDDPPTYEPGLIAENGVERLFFS